MHELSLIKFPMSASTAKVEKLLVELVELKDKLANAKEMLKSYKIKSDRLTELKRAKKEIAEQIESEKKRIEEEYLEDKDFEQAKQDELKYKNEVTEKNTDIREVVRELNVNQVVSTYDYNIKGEPMKMQVERVVKVYINGQEAR